MLSREDFFMIKQMRLQGAYIVDIATYMLSDSMHPPPQPEHLRNI